MGQLPWVVKTWIVYSPENILSMVKVRNRAGLGNG